MVQILNNKKLGASLDPNGVHFKVWAPKCHQVDVILKNKNEAVGPFPLIKEGTYFAGFIPGLKKGALYKYRLDQKESYPDPCSRYQPQGPHGPSMVVDPYYAWEDSIWQKKGIEIKGQIIYELHVGTFSKEGTYKGIINQLPELRKLGITIIEIMPIAEFPGRWNWGYDGVNLYAPAHVYGSPDDLRNLINSAHHLKMGVILDVVYNHFGPDGNYLRLFSDDYFALKHTTDWGEAINFDGPNASYVREFFVQNACYWIKEFHFDGLRLDATQNIYDKSDPHILVEITKTARESASPKKLVFIAENESQDAAMINTFDRKGCGIDALWNDDFHHTSRVALTGRREAYYTDYMGQAQEFIGLIKRGFLYQGQFYTWQNQMRGSYVPKDSVASNFVVYLQNHDQVANSLYGLRLTQKNDLSLCRALTTVLLLSPQTPMIFMGQEFGASSPFLFFVDHNEALAPKIFAGRKEFLAQFPSILKALKSVLDPSDEKAFYNSKLKFEERQTHKEIYKLHADLLRFRREDELFKQQDWSAIEGAVLNQNAFVLRYHGPQTHRLLIVNLGNDFDFSPSPEPLLAPLPGTSWHCIWSSEDVSYGGYGIVNAFTGQGWYLPARCAQVLVPIRVKTKLTALFNKKKTKQFYKGKLKNHG